MFFDLMVNGIDQFLSMVFIEAFQSVILFVKLELKRTWSISKVLMQVFFLECVGLELPMYLVCM